jgi:hypothetical protein
MIDPKLLDYCATDRQREIIQAVLEHGSANKAAKAMGANRRWIDETVLRVKGHAARQGWGPEYDLNAPDRAGSDFARFQYAVRR